MKFLYQMVRQLSTGPKTMMPLFLVAVFCCCLSQTFAETESSLSEESTATVASNTTNSTSSYKDMDMNNAGEKDSNNAGLIAGVLVPLFIVIAIGIIVFVIHKRRSRMMDNEKKMKIQMTSARNAGVYQDLTVNVPGDVEKPPPSPEHERLQSAEEI